MKSIYLFAIISVLVLCKSYLHKKNRKNKRILVKNDNIPEDSVLFMVIMSDIIIYFDIILK